MADSSSGGGAGGVSPFLTYSYDQMKEMAYADDPKEIRGHAAQWAQAARDLRIFQQMLHEEIGSLAGVYSSAAGAPALMRSLSAKASKLGDVAAKFERNAQALGVAAGALKTARDKLAAIEPSANQGTGVTWRDATQMGPMARQAALVMDELASAFDLARNQLESRPGDYYGSGDGPGIDRGLATHVSVPGPGRSGGTGGPGGLISGGIGQVPGGGPTAGNAPGGWLPPSSGGRIPTAPGQGGTIPGALPGTGRGGTSAGAGSPRAGTGGVGGSGARVRIPGARSGAPIGGYRPVAGTPATGFGSTTPGRSAPGQGGPGGPGRHGPGTVPPGGHGAAPGGKDRRGRRLTNYERLEPDTFRDTRHCTKPVIGEERRKPDTFKPTPGAISGGNKQQENDAPTVPDLPTAEAPARFEGQNVFFSRRPRSGR